MQRPYHLALLVLASLTVLAGAEEPMSVRSVAFSPDGKHLAVGRGLPDAKTGDVTLWNLADKKPAFRDEARRGFPSVAFSADGKRLAVASYDNVATLRETPSGKTLATFPHPDSVRAVALTPDGRTLVTSCRDKKVRIWDVADVKERFALPVKEVQRQISVHPEGRTFLLMDGEEIAVVDVETGASKFRFDGGQGRHLDFAIHSADGRWIVTSDNYVRVVVWNASDGKVHASYGGMFGYSALAFDPHREIAATSSCFSRKVRFARLCLTDPTVAEKARIQSLLGELDSDDPAVRERATAALVDLGFLARAAVKRAATEAASAEVRMRARWILEKVDEGHAELFPELPTTSAALAFSPDGRSLACGCDNGWTYVWDLETRKETARFRD